MQASDLQKMQEMTETTGCLNSHSKMPCIIGATNFDYKPRKFDKLFSEAGKFKTVLSCLVKVQQSLFLLSCLSRLDSVLTVSSEGSLSPVVAAIELLVSLILWQNERPQCLFTL